MSTETEPFWSQLAWIDIPSGFVTQQPGRLLTRNSYITEEPQLYAVSAFKIAKYPVTNLEFAVFVDTGGYEISRYWTVSGWDACQSGTMHAQRKVPPKDDSQSKGRFFNTVVERTGIAWREPKHWHESPWNTANRPVTGISWYEAIAYAKWLSAVSGMDCTLPTEQQWQRAAFGDQQTLYPWGNTWDCGRCNNNVHPCQSTATTSVDEYEGLGDSPFGVVDMCGNVWEWCLNEAESGKTDLEGTSKRILRGGSWFMQWEDEFGQPARLMQTPFERSDCYGFRLCQNILTAT